MRRACFGEVTDKGVRLLQTARTPRQAGPASVSVRASPNHLTVIISSRGDQYRFVERMSESAHHGPVSEADLHAVPSTRATQLTSQLAGPRAVLVPVAHPLLGHCAAAKCPQGRDYLEMMHFRVPGDRVLPLRTQFPPE